MQRIVLGLVIAALWSIAGGVDSAQAQSQYTRQDAHYVTDVRDNAVLDYVVCLESASKNSNTEQALVAAAADCQNLGQILDQSSTLPATGDLLGKILDCGFRAGQGTPGNDCGDVETTAAGPNFSDFRARLYTGQKKPLNLSSHPDARQFRSRLKEAASGTVNFAGEYIVSYWGCGTTCLMGAVIHAPTGRVEFLPGTICCWEDPEANPIDYQADSNLIVFTGYLNEEEPQSKHYFVLENGKFRFLKRLPVTPTSLTDADDGTSEQALVCYYGSSGAQLDADDCKVGLDLGDDQTTRYGAVCSTSARASCVVGSVGVCREGSKDYSHFSVHDRASLNQCPATYAKAISINSQSASTAEFDIRDGFDLPGGDYAQLPGEVSYQVCFSSCQQDSLCRGFTYNTRHSRCFLKSTTSNWAPFTNAISGIRGGPG